MGDETLLTSARRVRRFFEIVMAHGGLIDTEFQMAIDTLARQIFQEEKRIKMKSTHCVVSAIEHALTQQDARELEDLYDAAHQLILILSLSDYKHSVVSHNEYETSLLRLRDALAAVKGLQS